MTVDRGEELRAELASLRALVAQQASMIEDQAVRLRALEGRAAPPRRLPAQERGTAGETAPVPAVLSSRRGLLRGAGLASVGLAAAAVGSVAAASPAAATTGTMIYGTSNDSGTDSTWLRADTFQPTLLVSQSGEGPAIRASNSELSTSPVVLASTDSDQPALLGQSFNPHGTGVQGIAQDHGSAVHGLGKNYAVGVWGQNIHGFALAGVLGDAIGFSKGVWGRHTGTNTTGVGVWGDSEAGRGSSFGGKLAQLRLRPSPDATHPPGGQRGDFFVDSSGRLWFCKAPKVWKQLA